MVDYLIFTACHAVMTAAVFLTARALLSRIGRGSDARQFHGRYVLAWSVVGFAIGPYVWLAMIGQGLPRGGVSESLVASNVLGMLSLLVGWLVGTIHGGFMLSWRWFVMRRRTTAE